MISDLVFPKIRWWHRIRAVFADKHIIYVKNYRNKFIEIRIVTNLEMIFSHIAYYENNPQLTRYYVDGTTSDFGVEWYMSDRLRYKESKLRRSRSAKMNEHKELKDLYDL